MSRFVTVLALLGSLGCTVDPISPAGRPCGASPATCGPGTTCELATGRCVALDLMANDSPRFDHAAPPDSPRLDLPLGDSLGDARHDRPRDDQRRDLRMDLCTGDCVPGTAEPCGNCNQGTKSCTSQCAWSPCVETACKPSSTQVCGNCNTGIRSCSQTCSWGGCVGGGTCGPGTKENCPNSCGERTCSQSCAWGTCSLDKMPIKKAGQLCWSPNHCSIGKGKCMDCWLLCDGAGNLVKDSWCATCESCAGQVDQC